MKKITVMLSIFMLLAIVLTACGPKVTPVPTEVPPTDVPPTAVPEPTEVPPPVAPEVHLQIIGLVTNVQDLTVNQMRTLTPSDLEIDGTTYNGFRLATDVFGYVGVKPEAGLVVFTAVDGSSFEIPMTELQVCADCFLALTSGNDIELAMPGFETKYWMKQVRTIEFKELPFAGPDLSGVVVQFWHVYSDAPGEGLQALVDEYNATNPYNITVEALGQGNYGDVEDKINAGIQSGDLPDAVMAYTNSLADWYAVDTIVDLNPYINDPVVGLTTDQLNDLYPHLKAAGSTTDGAWVAYPMTQSANVLVYNSTWAQELGFANPPATSAELKDQICAAAAANTAKGGDFAGTGGMVYYPNATNFLHFLFAFGGYPLNEAGDAYDFNTQAAIDTSLYILDLKTNGCIFQTESYPNPEQALRKALITLSSTAGKPYYEAAFADAGNTTDVWGWLAAPGPDGTLAVNAFQQMLGVVSSTEDEQVASWLFIKWLTSPEIQARWIKISGYYGTQYSTEKLLADYAVEDPVWASGVALAAIGPSEPQTFPAWSSVRRAINDAAAELFNATDQAQIEAILATLTQTANDLVAELQ